MQNEIKLSSAEKWEKLTFADNYIFCKVMETNPDVCKEMLELLLNIKIERIEIPKTEYTIKTDYDSRGIRLDVYVKDETGRCFDIEIQTSVEKELALAKRTRYYQGLMDVDSVFTGINYKNLNETYVIFLCLGDAFDFGLPVYTFENVCTENPKVKMNDGTHKIFFNAQKYDTMNSEELKSFFKYLCGKEPSSDFSEKLSAIVKRIKMNARWRHEFMTWQDEIEFQAKKASEERAVETAQKMLDSNLGTPEQIASVTSLPLEKILELQKEAKLVKA